MITDLTMPGMTGDRLAREMIGIRQDIPIILCSGYCGTRTRSRASALGIKKCIEKPISTIILADAIREVLA